MIDVNLINGIALAFEGDAVYSMYIRRHLIFQGMTKPNKLHQAATCYVSARAQASLIESMLEQEILTEKELEIYKRGRNTNSHTKAKNADVVTYRMSTGFEAVMGYLHMTGELCSFRRADRLVHPASRRRNKAVKNIREWFPHAEVTDQAHPPAGYVAIPLQAHQWLLLKEEELTEREKQLISWLGGEEEVAPNPWYQYLIDGKGEAPQVIKKMQLVYCHISHSTAEGTVSWLEMMQTLLPNFRATLQLSGQDYVLILDQDQSLPVADILKDTVSAMEYDFTIRLSIYGRAGMDRVERWKIVSCHPSRMGRPLEPGSEKDTKASTAFLNSISGESSRQI